MATGPFLIFGEGGLQPAIAPEECKTEAVRLPGGVTLAAGQVLGQSTASTAQSEVQTVTITGAPTGGTFTLTFFGQATTPLAFNATTAAVQAALQALSSIGAGNALVTGTAGTSYVVTFAGALSNADVPLITASAAFTGGTTPAIAVAETTKGNPGAPYWNAYASGNGDGTQNPKMLLKYASSTDPTGRVIDSIGGGSQGGGRFEATAYYSGVYRTSELVGLDAAAVAALGRLITGSTAALTDPGTLLWLR